MIKIKELVEATDNLFWIVTDQNFNITSFSQGDLFGNLGNDLLGKNFLELMRTEQCRKYLKEGIYRDGMKSDSGEYQPFRENLILPQGRGETVNLWCFKWSYNQFIIIVEFMESVKNIDKIVHQHRVQSNNYRKAEKTLISTQTEMAALQSFVTNSSIEMLELISTVEKLLLKSKEYKTINEKTVNINQTDKFMKELRDQIEI